LNNLAFPKKKKKKGRNCTAYMKAARSTYRADDRAKGNCITRGKIKHTSKKGLQKRKGAEGGKKRVWLKSHCG